MPSRAALKMHDEIQEKKDEENNIFTKWQDLIIGHAYKILDVNRIKTAHGKASFFTLKKDNKTDKFNTWVPKRIVDAQKMSKGDIVIPLGLKSCKTNKKRRYHVFKMYNSKMLKRLEK